MESLNKKKNALDFAIFLREIGYASTARGQDFEWLFDYPSTRPFLKLLSTSISGTTNVLSTEEVSHWRSIPPKDYKTGSELADALLCLERLEEDAEQENEAEQLRGEVGTMEMELQRLQSRLSALELKRDKLQALSSSCQRRKAALVAEEQEHRAHVAKMEQQLAKEYDEMGAALAELTSTVVPLFSNLERQLGDGDYGKENVWPVAPQATCTTECSSTLPPSPTPLHAIALDEYAMLEKSLAGKLRGHLRGLNGANGTPLPVSEREHVGLASCLPHSDLNPEVQRLKKILPLGESKYVEALIQLSRARGSYSALQVLTPARYADMPDLTVKQRIAEAEGALAKMEAAIAHHKQTTLPQLWGALSALKVLPILHADYDAKLERQAKRGLVLDKAAAVLVGQEARHKLLRAAMQQERERQRQLYGLMSSLLNELTDHAAALECTLSLVTRHEDPTLARVCQVLTNSTTLPSAQLGECGAGRSDKTSSNSTENPSRQSEENQKLAEAAEALALRLSAARTGLQTFRTSRDKAVAESEQHAEQICALAGPTGPGEHVQLTSPAVRSGLAKLETALQELQIAVDGVAGDYKMKQTALLHNPKEAAVERELFERFFTEAYVPL